jgi:DNA (cytosine-5)-methyltransferase 1
VREAALLQGFPPDYYFEGPFDDKFKQIGNAVSPKFGRQVALHIAEEWRNDHASSLDVDTILDVDQPLTKSFSSSITHIKRARANS